MTARRALLAVFLSCAAPGTLAGGGEALEHDGQVAGLKSFEADFEAAVTRGDGDR